MQNNDIFNFIKKQNEIQQEMLSNMPSEIVQNRKNIANLSKQIKTKIHFNTVDIPNFNISNPLVNNPLFKAILSNHNNINRLMNSSMLKEISESNNRLTNHLFNNNFLKSNYNKYWPNLYKLTNISQYLDTYNITQRHLKNVKNKYNSYYSYIQNINKINWVVINSRRLLSNKELNKRNKLSLNRLDNLIYDDFMKNHHKLLNMEINDLIMNMRHKESSIMQGYANKTQQLFNIFCKDTSIGIFCIPYLFTLLEALYWKTNISKMWHNKPKEIINYNLLKKKKDSIKDNFNSKQDIQSLFILFSFNIYYVTLNFYTKFDSNLDPNKMTITRNSVLHGKINPDRFDLKIFVKLISLCSSVSALLKKN